MQSFCGNADDDVDDFCQQEMPCRNQSQCDTVYHEVMAPQSNEKQHWKHDNYLHTEGAHVRLFHCSWSLFCLYFFFHEVFVVEASQMVMVIQSQEIAGSNPVCADFWWWCVMCWHPIPTPGVFKCSPWKGKCITSGSDWRWSECSSGPPAEFFEKTPFCWWEGEGNTRDRVNVCLQSFDFSRRQDWVYNTNRYTSAPEKKLKRGCDRREFGDSSVCGDANKNAAPNCWTVLTRISKAGIWMIHTHSVS